MTAAADPGPTTPARSGRNQVLAGLLLVITLAAMDAATVDREAGERP